MHALEKSSESVERERLLVIASLFLARDQNQETTITQQQTQSSIHRFMHRVCGINGMSRRESSKDIHMMSLQERDRRENKRLRQHCNQSKQ